MMKRRYQKDPKLRAYRYLCFCLLGLKMIIMFIFSHVGLTGCVVGYSILGGWIFKGLEAPYERELRRQAGEIRDKYTRQIVKVSEEALRDGQNPSNASADLVQEFEEEIVRFTDATGWDGSEDEEEVKWSYSGALLYSVTVITTIGYGHIAPKTKWGRIVTMIYAIFGIPLTILCLSIIGSSMASVFKFVYKNFCLGLYRQCRRFRAYLDSDEGIPLDAATAAAAAVPNVLVAAGVAAAAEEANIAAQTGFSSEKLTITESSGKTVNLQDGQDMWEVRRTWPDGGDYRRNSSYMRSIPGRGEEECLERAYLAAIGTIEDNEMEAIDQIKESDDVSSPSEIELDESISEERHDDVVTVPVTVSLLVFAAYIFLGAFLFSLWEKDWDYLVGSYFCFITLSTIGFGDVVPGSTGDSWASAKKQALCSIYLLFGMAMTVMCIKLMQQAVRLKFKNLGRKIGLIETDDEEERTKRRKRKKQKEVDENLSECKNYDKTSSSVINLQ